MRTKIPPKIAAVCRTNDEWLRWLDRLPGTLEDLTQRWSLELGDPFDGDDVSCAWVAPVTLANRTTAILKVAIPHMEGEHEIAGLRFWAGDPTVLLLEADTECGAMLLERCEPGTRLRASPENEQHIVIASLLRGLWRVPPPHVFRPLSAMTAYWAAEILAAGEHWPDSGLVSDGLKLFAELSASSPRDVLLATDLHAGNVLRAQRERWLVIDPKPFVGDPSYDATQHLLNTYERLLSDPERTIKRFADLLDLDWERVRLWMFARAAFQAAAHPQNNRWRELALRVARSG